MMICEKSFDTGEVVLNYAEGPDNGPPVLFIHGISGRWQYWYPILTQISMRWHVYAMDLRGHGKSEWKTGHYTLEDYRKDIVSFIDNLVKEPVTLVGARAHPSFSTFPISSENQLKIIEIVTGKRAYSSEIVNLTQAKELLERGYYTLSYLQFVRSVEESITKYIILKMRANNCSPSEIDVYKTLSLGQKLKNFPMGDPRKLDTHFGSNPNWRSIWDNLWNMKLKRDLLMHYSTEATRLEVLQVRSWVIDFRKIL